MAKRVYPPGDAPPKFGPDPTIKGSQYPHRRRRTAAATGCAICRARGGKRDWCRDRIRRNQFVLVPESCGGVCNVDHACPARITNAAGLYQSVSQRTCPLKCELCYDIRRFLVMEQGFDSKELQ